MNYDNLLWGKKGVFGCIDLRENGRKWAKNGIFVRFGCTKAIFRVCAVDFYSRDV